MTKVLAGLVILLTTSCSPGTSSASFSLQAETKQGSASGRLLSDLKNRDPKTRRLAAEQLGGLRNQGAVRQLIPLLSDKDASVREAVAFALGQMTDRRAFEALTKALDDKEAEARASAAFALGMLDDHKGTQALLGLLSDGETAARSGAVTGLGLLQDGSAMDELIGMLNDSSFDVRYDAVWALGQLGEPDAASHLRAALINLDLIRLDTKSKEAFRQAVQFALDNLRVPSAEGGRPRRVGPPGGDPARLPENSRPAAVRQAVIPASTERASRAGQRGVVGLRVLVGAEGRAVRAYVVQRQGRGLDQRAVQAVLMYRFDPALLKGLPQTEWMNLDVKFE